MAGTETMQDTLRQIVGRYGRVSLNPLQDDDFDLFAAGLDSFGMVDVMMVVEEEFGVVFTPAALNRRSFASVNALSAVIAGLRTADSAAAMPDPAPQPASGHPVGG